jgi:hypothetical protein
MTIEESFNYCEAGLWFLIAIVLLVRSRAVPQIPRRLGAIAAAAFFLFGISDLIEAQTGAWWKPWWLFVLKAACVVGFGGCGWKYREWLKSRKPPSGD